MFHHHQGVLWIRVPHFECVAGSFIGSHAGECVDGKVVLCTGEVVVASSCCKGGFAVAWGVDDEDVKAAKGDYGGTHGVADVVEVVDVALGRGMGHYRSGVANDAPGMRARCTGPSPGLCHPAIASTWPCCVIEAQHGKIGQPRLMRRPSRYPLCMPIQLLFFPSGRGTLRGGGWWTCWSAKNDQEETELMSYIDGGRISCMHWQHGGNHAQHCCVCEGSPDIQPI